jgi:broad specificity phosphatase PhoE
VQILWARHGQNFANLTGTFSYRVFDGDLTELGQRQAAEMAARLAALTADDPVGLLACSPLRRARQTAQIVGSALGLPVALELDDLRELNVGALDGRSDPHAWRNYDRVLAAWRAGDTHVRFPDGEDCDELCARLRRALLTVARHSAGKTALVVAHGASLRAALPGLAAAEDPGADLPTGAFATLRLTVQLGSSLSDAAIQVLSWAGGSADHRDRDSPARPT